MDGNLHSESVTRSPVSLPEVNSEEQDNITVIQDSKEGCEGTVVFIALINLLIISI